MLRARDETDEMSVIEGASRIPFRRGRGVCYGYHNYKNLAKQKQHVSQLLFFSFSFFFVSIYMGRNGDPTGHTTTYNCRQEKKSKKKRRKD